MTQSERPSAAMSTHSHSSARLSRLDAADIAAARQRYTLVEILERHGIAVVGSGPRRTARCPFHDDQSPSLSVYLDSNRYYCFACGASGDAISLLQRLEGLDFREAVVRLIQSSAETSTSPGAQPSVQPGAERDTTITAYDAAPSADAQETLFQESAKGVSRPLHAHVAPQAVDLLTVAAALYQAALTVSQEAHAYLRARDIKADTARRMHVGYGQPGALRDFLSDDPGLVAQAHALGLLDGYGKERLAGRIIIPELRDGRCLWMVGRTLASDDMTHISTDQDPQPPAGPPADRGSAHHVARTPPKYLGVTAPKPLMGIGALRSAEPSTDRAAAPTSRSMRTRTSDGGVSGVIVVEGPFDLLAAQQWRLPLPCVALVGAQTSHEQLLELMAFAAGRPIWLALDADAAGDAGAAHLRAALIAQRYAGPLYRLHPPLGAKDFGEVTGRLIARTALLRTLAHPEGGAVIPSDIAGSAAPTTSRMRAVEASS